VIWTLVSVAIIIVIARCYTQRFVTHQFGFSEVLVSISAVSRNSPSLYILAKCKIVHLHWHGITPYDAVSLRMGPSLHLYSPIGCHLRCEIQYNKPVIRYGYSISIM
jgi:hypothetical protein